MRAVLAVSILMLGLSACTAPRTLTGSPDLQVVSGNELQPPSAAAIGEPTRPYLVGPLDRLRIDVYGIADLSQREVRVDASGRLQFPFAGTLDVAGKTPNEVAALIEGRLGQNYIRNPQVTVNIQESVSQVMTIDGQVREPGLYPVIGRMTLMRAVATAKGLGEFARPNHVVIFRTVEGRRMAALYDLRAIRDGLYRDPEVYANDIVVVGDSQAKRLFKDVIAASALITTPLILLLQ